jgi:hypothetical protein
MIYISKITADPSGLLPIRNYQLSGDYDSTARISRTALLDGTSYLANFGVSDTDRDFVIDCRVTAAEAIRLRAMYEAAELIRLSFWEGSYLAMIYRLFVKRNGETNITFYFKEKLR